MTVLQRFSFFFFTFSLIGFGAQLIGPIQLHVKRQNLSICKFFQDLLGLCSVCEWQDLSFTYQKSEKTTYLDNLVFSTFSVLWGTVKKSGLKSDPRQTLPGECAGESVTKKSTQRCIFLHQPDKHRPILNHMYI